MSGLWLSNEREFASWDVNRKTAGIQNPQDLEAPFTLEESVRIKLALAGLAQ